MGTFELPSIESVLSSQEERVLRRLIPLGLTNLFLDAHPNNLRSKYTVSSKSTYCSVGVGEKHIRLAYLLQHFEESYF